MARSSTTWIAGRPNPNPGGKALPERLAARTIAETFRELADPIEIGRSLLALYSGIDPFARPDAPNPDGLPTPGKVPIDMTHRMAALKMFLEYGYGKPLQGVVVDARVRQETTVREERTTVVELREVAKNSPAAREALRTIARAMLGAPVLEQVAVDARHVVPLGGVAETLGHPAPELAAEAVGAPERVAEGSGEQLAGYLDVGDPSPEELEEDELDGEEDGPVAEDVGDQGELAEVHAQMIAELDAAVNGEEKKTPERLPGAVL